jgi:hypothetical protein
MDSIHSIKRVPCTIALSALIMLGSMMLGGCHANFHKRWHDIETKRPTSAPGDPMVGVWDGYWIDTGNFHAGRLRAIVSKESDQKYKVDFLANFPLLFIPCSAEYSITVETDKPPQARSGVSFHGENDLGWLFGLFTYNGTVENGQWVNTFESKSGDGEFRLHRPQLP